MKKEDKDEFNNNEEDMDSIIEKLLDDFEEDSDINPTEFDKDSFVYEYNMYIERLHNLKDLNHEIKMINKLRKMTSVTESELNDYKSSLEASYLFCIKKTNHLNEYDVNLFKNSVVFMDMDYLYFKIRKSAIEGELEDYENYVTDNYGVNSLIVEKLGFVYLKIRTDNFKTHIIDSYGYDKLCDVYGKELVDEEPSGIFLVVLDSFERIIFSSFNSDESLYDIFGKDLILFSPDVNGYYFEYIDGIISREEVNSIKENYNSFHDINKIVSKYSENIYTDYKRLHKDFHDVWPDDCEDKARDNEDSIDGVESCFERGYNLSDDELGWFHERKD